MTVMTVGMDVAAPLRLTRRGRLVMFIGVLLVVMGAAWGANAVAGESGRPTRVQVHTVGSGETVWGYASRIAERGQDVRDVVATIVELNGLRSADLAAGQRILLPVD